MVQHGHFTHGTRDPASRVQSRACCAGHRSPAAVAPEFSRSRSPLELEVLGGLARAEVVFELLEQRLDARPRELGVDAQLRVALLERVLPGLGQCLDGLLQLAPRLPGMPRYAVRTARPRLVRVPYDSTEAPGRTRQQSRLPKLVV